MSGARIALEMAALRSLFMLSRLLPRRATHMLGAWAGRVGALVDRRHHRIALDNLRLALGGEMDDAARRRTARACWQHFGRITLDALLFPRLSQASVGTIVRYEGLEHIRSAYAGGKGVILFSAHFGHWELAALMQGYLGMPMALVARPLDNPHLEAALARLRGASGNVIIHKRRAVREMLRAIHQGIGVAILIDQDARDHGVFVPFFGRPASTTPTLALLALRTGAPVIPVHSLPEEHGGWRVVYEPEIPIRNTGDRDADVSRITAACTQTVEGWVRRRPELWLWMHRRWKTQPR